MRYLGLEEDISDDINYRLWIRKYSSFSKYFNKLGIKAQRASNVLQLKEASHLLPGVGHFDHAMKKLGDSDLRDCLEDLVIDLKFQYLEYDWYANVSR